MKKEERKKLEETLTAEIKAVFGKINSKAASKIEKEIKKQVKVLSKSFTRLVKLENKKAKA